MPHFFTKISTICPPRFRETKVGSRKNMKKNSHPGYYNGKATGLCEPAYGTASNSIRCVGLQRQIIVNATSGKKRRLVKTPHLLVLCRASYRCPQATDAYRSVGFSVADVVTEALPPPRLWRGCLHGSCGRCRLPHNCS